jgi:chitinase
MKTLEELIQDALDHGIVDTREELPYVDVNGEWMALDGHKLRRFLTVALESARDTGCPRFTELPDGQVNVKMPTNIESLASGYCEARQCNTGVAHLKSNTGKVEVGFLQYDMVTNRNWFAVVADIQESLKV